MHPLVRRIFASLCLALALLLAATPAWGLTLCIEEDGCITVALSASEDHCGGCDPHATEGRASSAFDLDAVPQDCPCADLTVIRSGDGRWRQPRAADLPQPESFAILHESVEQPIERALPARCARPPAVLAGEHSLANRSVVLLV
ncbi:MAG: hypothetical protein HZA52_14305 [Planctomycetes bacterium]|nr:hypothetical protein [Planctomycetota bacterium]